MKPNTTKELEEWPMAGEMTTGTILIKDGALLPNDLRLETNPCVPGWSVVKNFDASELDREIEKTRWTFFSLAGALEATVFGIDVQKMVRRAIKRILANPNSERFNALEITRVASVGSGRFPGVRFITVSAISRHIQESLILFCVNDVQESGATRIACGPKLALAAGSEQSPERTKGLPVGATN